MQPDLFQGLKLDRRTADAPAPFALACACGETVRGVRLSQSQTVRCPSCQTERFVLPRSPLAAVADDITVAAPSGHRKWRIPAAVGAVVLALVGFIAIIYVVTRKPAANGRPAPVARGFEEHREAGEAAFASGAYQQASAEWKAALEIAERTPGKFSPSERRDLTRLHQEAALLADLLSESLAEVIRHSIGTSEAEWQAVFARRYAGRSVLFDDIVHRDAGGQYRSGFRIRVTGGEGRIDLKGLRLLALEQIPALSAPQRVLLGFRLAGLRRDGAIWTVVPEPDSGVLLTDSRVLAGLSLPEDPEILDVLKRQKFWMDQLP